MKDTIKQKKVVEAIERDNEILSEFCGKLYIKWLISEQGSILSYGTTADYPLVRIDNQEKFIAFVAEEIDKNEYPQEFKEKVIPYIRESSSIGVYIATEAKLKQSVYNEYENWNVDNVINKIERDEFKKYLEKQGGLSDEELIFANELIDSPWFEELVENYKVIAIARIKIFGE